MRQKSNPNQKDRRSVNGCNYLRYDGDDKAPGLASGCDDHEKVTKSTISRNQLIRVDSTNIIRMCKTIQTAFQRDRVLRCALFHTSTRYINRLWALEITRKKDFIVQPILITIENLPRLYYKGRFSGQV
jgi:hypothetical protein